MKRFLFGLLIVFLCVNTISAQEKDFHFSNWPLTDFEKRKVIKPLNLDKKESHTGMDVSAKVGEEVKAVADGRVYWTYSGGAHGVSVGIEHENGWRTTYLHLSERLVKRGQTVRAADVIGKVGVTGSGRDSEVSHLHFALIINPKVSVEDLSNRYGDPLAYGSVQTVREAEGNAKAESKSEPVVEIVNSAQPKLQVISEGQKIEQKVVSNGLLAEKATQVEQLEAKGFVQSSVKKQTAFTESKAPSKNIGRSLVKALSNEKMAQPAKTRAVKQGSKIAPGMGFVQAKARIKAVLRKSSEKVIPTNKHLSIEEGDRHRNSAGPAFQGSALFYLSLLLLLIPALFLGIYVPRGKIKNIGFTC